MTKDKFIRKLISKLQLHFNSKELNEIINDYNDFFLAGFDDGQSEEELCKTFGDPNTIVRNIRAESRRSKAKRFSFRFIVRILLAFALSIYVISIISHINSNANMVKDSVIGVIIIGLLLWFILGGEPLDRPTIYNFKQVNNRKIVYLHLIIFILTGLTYIFALFFSNINKSLKGYLFKIEIYEIGTFVSKVLYLMIILGLLLLVYSIYKFYNCSIKFYTITCNTLGYIAFILCLLNVQHQLIDINDIKYLLVKSLLAYFTGIALSVLATIYIYQIYRGRASLWMHKSKREY